MASASYQHLILLGEHSNLSLPSLYEKIQNIDWAGRAVVIDQTEDGIIINIEGWHFEIGWNTAEHVLEESVEIADEHAKGKPFYNAIKQCSQRLEIGGDADFDMVFFNDFCFILEKIESFEEVYTWNYHEGFLNV